MRCKVVNILSENQCHLWTPYPVSVTIISFQFSYNMILLRFYIEKKAFLISGVMRGQMESILLYQTRLENIDLILGSYLINLLRPKRFFFNLLVLDPRRLVLSPKYRWYLDNLQISLFLTLFFNKFLQNQTNSSKKIHC